MKVAHLDMSVAARVHFCLMEGEEEVIRETGVSSSKSTDSSCSGSGCGEDESVILTNNKYHCWFEETCL